MNIEELKKKMKQKIVEAKKSGKFLAMHPYVAFDNWNADEIIAFAPTEKQAKEASIIKGNHFPIIIDICTFFSSSK